MTRRNNNHSTKRGPLKGAVGDDSRKDIRKPESRQQFPNAIWTSTLDGQYAVKVTRLAGYRGELTIHQGEKLIHKEAVGLAYGAVFGPDIEDVATWQEMAIKVVDGLQARDKNAERA